MSARLPHRRRARAVDEYEREEEDTTGAKLSNGGKRAKPID
ncbi:hypothetical protein ACP4OV_002814 [Aristida adscensionis]